MENDDGTVTGISKLFATLSRGDLNVRFICKVNSIALDEPILYWVAPDVDGKMFVNKSRNFNGSRIETKYRVFISVKPTGLRLSGVQSHVVQGNNVLLECVVTGAKPAAEITWQNNSLPINNTKQVETKSEPTVSHILLILTNFLMRTVIERREENYIWLN